MPALHTILVPAALGLLLSGCTMARIYATSGNTVAMTELKASAGEAFRIEERRTFDFTSAVDVQELLRERFGSGRQFQNVSVKVKTDAADFLLNFVTLGLAQSKTFEISGDKIPE